MFLCVYVFCIHLSSLFLRRGELLLMGFVGVAGVGWGGGGGGSFLFFSFLPSFFADGTAFKRYR